VTLVQSQALKGHLVCIRDGKKQENYAMDISGIFIAPWIFRIYRKEYFAS